MDYLLLLHFLVLSSHLTNVCTQGCGKCSSFTDGFTEIIYKPSEATIRNPERGGAFIALSKAAAQYPQNLTADMFSTAINTYGPINIVWRQWYLDFTDDISTDYLSIIESDFNVIRAAGFKATIRFAYTETLALGIREMSPSDIEHHINQLKTIFEANEDVILSVQAGFIGVDGQWYYTSHFGDEGEISGSELQDIRIVVNKLLQALPASRSVQVRTTRYKTMVTQNTEPLNASDYRKEEVFAARIGYHNDCFLGDSTTPPMYSNVTTDYPYLAEDTKYVPMGGETCALNAPRSNCGTAKEELEKFHWTFLNLSNKTEVYDTWKSGNCYDEILNKLGYSLTLVSSRLPNQVESGADACFLVKFKNTGYAAPMNPRDVKLVLRGSTMNYTSSHIPDFTAAEPWLPESGTISVSFTMKMDVPAGDYEILLELSDPLLADDPRYSIILLNENVPEIVTGLNHLGHIVTVVASSTAAGSCSGFTDKIITNSTTTIRCFKKCRGLQFDGIPVTEEPPQNGVAKQEFSIVNSLNLFAILYFFISFIV